MTAGLTEFRTLGRSGLVVSSAALGTMTFGRQGWGSTDEVSRAVFDAYVDAGGNFIDTAEIYSAGRSEEMVGAYVADRKVREKMVLATKFGWNAAGHPSGVLRRELSCGRLLLYSKFRRLAHAAVGARCLRSDGGKR